MIFLSSPKVKTRQVAEAWSHRSGQNLSFQRKPPTVRPLLVTLRGVVISPDRPLPSRSGYCRNKTALCFFASMFFPSTVKWAYSFSPNVLLLPSVASFTTLLFLFLDLSHVVPCFWNMVLEGEISHYNYFRVLFFLRIILFKVYICTFSFPHISLWLKDSALK